MPRNADLPPTTILYIDPNDFERTVFVEELQRGSPDYRIRGLHQIAIQNGAFACFIKAFTSDEDLDRAIQRAIAYVGPMPKEDLHGPF